MDIFQSTLAIGAVTAITCSLCGVLLVVKREALVSEGLSHAVLPGIVVAFVFVQDRSAPLLIVAAAMTGLVMVLLVQALQRTGLVATDASLGIVFAAMFSGGIILAHLELRNIHFHAECIIFGNLALAPLETFVVGGIEVPKALCVMSGVLMLILLFVLAFYKELSVMLFDETLATSFGFRPRLMHLSWLALVSTTTVTAFETAGSILVVALMITPPATAFLLTNRLGPMLGLSAAIGAASAVAGIYWGNALDISPTGPMCSSCGLVFLVVLALAPRRGLLSQWLRRRRQTVELMEQLMLEIATQQSPLRDDLVGQFSNRGDARRVLQSLVDNGQAVIHNERVTIPV